MSIIWNVDRARPVREPMPYREAVRIADELEQRTGMHYTIL